MLGIITIVLAVVGAIAILVVIAYMIDEHRNPTPNPFTQGPGQLGANSVDRDLLRDIDNELRAKSKRNGFMMDRYGVYMPTTEPTLRGRVDAIEEHLGIEVVITPAVAEKLTVVKKVTKKVKK